MTPRLQRAIDFMTAAHRSIDQRRKDNVRLYEIHPLDVLARVSKVTVDEDVLIAALLHDVVEDVFPKNEFYSLSEIGREFGGRVAGFVHELTDEYTKENYPDKNRKERKQLERERYQTFSREVKLIKLADIAANLADDGEVLLADGGPEVGFNQMFIREKAKCLPYLREDYMENKILHATALDVLARQAKKFGVRL